MYNNICAIGKDVQTSSDVKQVKAYDQGVGTGYSALDRITGGLEGAGIDKNIKDMYTFICLNYALDDEIYLFGFSRGAYTARSIGGFIRNCGLLKPENIQMVDKAYNLYRDRNSYSSPESDMMTAWRANFCFEDVTPITFIGVWDTVGSLGIPLSSLATYNKEKYKFHDCTLSSYVKNAYHALAIDEHRRLFLPTLWEKSVSSNNSEAREDQKLEQRWFVGVHSNIGGGYADSGLSDIPLSWLATKAQNIGLCFHDPLTIPNEANYNGEIRDSYGFKYWLFGSKYREINLKDPKYNQTIDDSVYERYKADAKYRPVNLKLS
ncbi:DUF2235 domain-containing protein [Mucilaginibacter gynuensis]|uniref:DUF2235 domain-containing protein n=1 Tax=Mucilaginibacter gynuensis TaxID=1302236 RepID=A0ABP8FU30_9SPHI